MYVVVEKEMGHKRGQRYLCKSTMCAFQLLRLEKGTSQAKVMLKREEIKPIALSIAELCLVEDISQSEKFS